MKVLHLYYDLMNLYGEVGNVKAIEKSCKDHGVKLEVIRKSLNEKIDLRGVDLIYIGSGTENNQILALGHLMNYKEELKEYVKQGGKVLATGNAMEMFGQYIIKKDGEKVKGLGLLDFWAEEAEKRIIGDIEIQTAFGEIRGFSNHAGYLKNAEKYGKDILRYKNWYGTYIIGPILVRNPDFCANLLCF